MELNVDRRAEFLAHPNANLRSIDLQGLLLRRLLRTVTCGAFDRPGANLAQNYPETAAIVEAQF